MATVTAAAAAATAAEPIITAAAVSLTLDYSINLIGRRAGFRGQTDFLDWFNY